jgi:hypothetical protein
MKTISSNYESLLKSLDELIDIFKLPDFDKEESTKGRNEYVY